MPPEVDDFDLGKTLSRRPARQRDQAKSALGSAVIGLERGGRATEHADRARIPCSQQSHVASMVSKAVVLLERGVMLFVDDDDAELGYRRKQRRPGSDRDPHLSTAKRSPRVVALPDGQTAVQDRDFVSESGTEATDELWGERDLGNQ